MMKTFNKTVAAAALLTASLAPLSVGAQEFAAEVPEEDIEETVQHCTAEWLRSRAANTCLPTSIEVDSVGSAASPPECDFTLNCVVNMECSFTQPCSPSTGAIAAQGIKWKGIVHDVVNLRNCGGIIQVGSCP